MNKPEGFGTITPYFFIDHADNFISFLEKAFNGIELLKSLRPDKKIANAQIKIGDTVIMISEASADFPAMPASYYIYVSSCDETMLKAIHSGATKIMDVTNMHYGDRQGGVKDPFGNIWWISERIVRDSYSE